MSAEDYTFVTVDSDAEMTAWSDAVVIDLDEQNELAEAIVIDEDFGSSDFIMLADDTVMLSDADMIDIGFTDMELDGTAISFDL